MNRTRKLTVVTAGLALATSSLMGASVAVADDDHDDDDHGRYYDDDRYERDDDDRYERDDDDRYDDDRNYNDDQVLQPLTRKRSVACSGSSDAVLTVKRASKKRLAVNVAIDNSTPTDEWLVEVWHNGRQRLSTVRSADGAGAVSAKRSVKNRRGKDRLRLRATSEVGERCTAKVKGFKGAARSPKGKSGGAPGNNTSRPS